MQRNLSDWIIQSNPGDSMHFNHSWKLLDRRNCPSMPQGNIFHRIRRHSLHRLCPRHIQQCHWSELADRLCALLPRHLYPNPWIRCLCKLQPRQVQRDHGKHCMHCLPYRKVHHCPRSNKRLYLVLERNKFYNGHRINCLHCLHNLLSNRSKNPNVLHAYIQHHLWCMHSSSQLLLRPRNTLWKRHQSKLPMPVWL